MNSDKKVDMRTLTSRANAEKARLTKLKKLEKQRELRQKYEDYDSESESESEEEIILYPKKSKSKIILPGGNSRDREKINSIAVLPERRRKVSSDSNEAKAIREELSELKLMMQMMSKQKKKPTKKIYIEKEPSIMEQNQYNKNIPSPFLQKGERQDVPNNPFMSHMKSKILNF
jgi:hypothetical protein